MGRCIQLAELSYGKVAPNPLVGAVLVYEGRIIGEGYHEEFGKAHAEVNCINSVGQEDTPLIPLSTLYVSLEPCAHFGKTPPCADMIIQQGIKNVKIGCIDIFQKVHGKGVSRLKEAGVQVETGICEQACIDLNKRFFTFHSMKRPYIILKWAQSMNRMVGRSGQQISISNEYTNIVVHKWRSREASILVGKNTAVIDDPSLTNRHWHGGGPLRIILSGDDLPEDLQMFTLPGKTIVFNTDRDVEKDRVQFKKVSRQNYLEEMFGYLFESGIQSVLVEGGPATHQQFFDSGAWDECRVITNTKMVIENGVVAALMPAMKLISQETIMNDLIQYYGNSHNQFIAFD